MMTVDEKYAREVAERLKLSEEEFQFKMGILKRLGFFADDDRRSNVCQANFNIN